MRISDWSSDVCSSDLTVNRRDGDIAATNDFNDVLVNVGLQLPLGINEPAPEPAAEPVQVVVPNAPSDSDGDGVPEDKDQCPATPAGNQVRSEESREGQEYVSKCSYRWSADT